MSSYHRFIRRGFSSLFKQEQGVVGIMSAFLIFVCIGFAALAIDASYWYMTKRKLQLAADAGAAGGGLALLIGRTDLISPYATQDVLLNGFTSDDILAINYPPASGPYAGNTGAVEVILAQEAPLFLSKLFLADNPTIQARAVVGGESFPACGLILDTNVISGANLKLQGSTDLNASTCGFIVNGVPGQTAIEFIGNPTASFAGLTTQGTVSGSSTNVTDGNGNPLAITENSSAGAIDPYASLSIPAPTGTNFGDYAPGNKIVDTVNPGVYTSFQVSNKGTIITMNPGVYYIDGGNFTVGPGVVNGTDVTIIMTNSGGGKSGTVNLGGNGTMNLAAPTSGTFKDLLFIGDRVASPANENYFGGTGTLNFVGTVYFPKDIVHFQGNAGTGTGCFQIIVAQLELAGNPAAGACGSGIGTGLTSVDFLE